MTCVRWMQVRFIFIVLLILMGIGRGEILLNEIHLNVPGADGSNEFMELISTTDGVESCVGLTVLVINNDRIDGDLPVTDPSRVLNTGLIREAWDLNELTTGGNGLLLLGNGYLTSPRGGPWAGAIDPATAVGDPPGMGDGDLGPNDGATILLVSLYTGGRDAAGLWPDLDVDGNGVFDWTQSPQPPGGLRAAPWVEIVDSIGWRDRAEDNGNLVFNPYTVSAANLSTVWAASRMGNRDPHTLARVLHEWTANAAVQWYGGRLAGTSPTSVTYNGTRVFGSDGLIGEVTPGRVNLESTLPPADFRINEVMLHPGGKDERFQYVEILNTVGAARSLSGCRLILMDSLDDGAVDADVGVGRILESWDLSDFATGSNGLLLLGDGYSPGYTPWQDSVALATGTGDPAARLTAPIATGWGEGDLRSHRGLTLLLVRGYIPPTDADLDVNDDGMLDGNLPWAELLDGMGFSQAGRSAAGHTYAEVDLRTVMTGNMAPGHLFRKAADLRRQPGAWAGGVMWSSAASFSLSYAWSPALATDATLGDMWFGGFRGYATPGQPNPGEPTRHDGVRLNEIMINPSNHVTTGTDETGEYIELIAIDDAIIPLDGLWLVVVNLGVRRGEVVASVHLDGYSTGLNRIALCGQDYDNNNAYAYREVDGELVPTTAAIDPPQGLPPDGIPNEGVAILLLRDPIVSPSSPLEMTIFPNTRQLHGDLDPDDDGLLLPPEAFCGRLVDSLCVSGRTAGAGYGWLSTAEEEIHHAARRPDALAAHDPGAWYAGQLPQMARPLALDYSLTVRGSFLGSASPGRPNHIAPRGNTGREAVVMNEVHLNPPGRDADREFVELLDTSRCARSLNGYSLLMLGNTLPETGKVTRAWSLDGLATGENGLLLLSAGRAWQPMVRAATAMATPRGRSGLESSWDVGTLAVETENQNALFLLVRGFDRWIGYDTDTQTTEDAETGGDGIFDKTPWKGPVHDGIVLRSQIGSAAPFVWDGWTYGLADLSSLTSPFYHCESVGRFLGENSPVAAAAWYGGDTTGDDPFATFYLDTDPSHAPFPADFTAHVTPGQPNLPGDPYGDIDHDGLPNGWEIATGSDPQQAASPSVWQLQHNAFEDLFSYQRLVGGDPGLNPQYAAEAWAYDVEWSTDGQQWSTVGLQPLQVVREGNGLTETATVRLPYANVPRRFFRLRVSRLSRR